MSSLKRKAITCPPTSPKKPRFEESVYEGSNSIRQPQDDERPQNERQQPQKTQLDSPQTKRNRNGQRHHYRSRSPKHEQSHLNSFNGQRCAIPGLDDFNNDEAEDQEGDLDEEAQRTKDALNYLRSVRNEAARIPQLLVADATESSNGMKNRRRGAEEIDDKDQEELDDVYEQEIMYDEVSDSMEEMRGFYSDGVYAAYEPMAAALSPSHESTDDADGARLISAQSYYQASLLRRYDSIRHSLSATPPASALATLDRKLHPNRVGPYNSSRKERQRWIVAVLNAAPKRVQLAAMDQWDALWLLELVGETLLSWEMINQSGPLGKRLSAWIWGLLGRVAGREVMSSEEVAKLREVGKTAVRLVKVLLGGDDDLRNATKKSLLQVETIEDQTIQDGSVSEEAINAAVVEEQQTSINHIANASETWSRHDNSDGKKQKQQHNTRRRRNSSSSIESDLQDYRSNEDIVYHSDFGHEPSPQDNPKNSTARVLNGDSLTTESEPVEPDVFSREGVSGASSPLPNPQDRSVIDVLGLIAAARSDLPVEMSGSQHQAGLQQDDSLSATLNFILTVVGERYGQRDLLWARDELWSMHE